MNRIKFFFLPQFHSCKWVFYLICIIGFFCSLSSIAQVQHALIKTFDPSLNRIPNIDVSVNGKPFVNVGAKGETLVALDPQDIPLRSITFNDPAVEAASWNYSKGVIEVIVRRKSYKMALVYVQDADNKTLRNVSVTFKGAKTTTATTDSNGKVEIPLALDEKIRSVDQFDVPDFQVVSLLSAETRNVLTVRKPRVATALPEAVKTKTDFPIDSIKSLEQFYALFKDYQTEDLTPEMRVRLNEKLKSLMRDFEDSVRSTEVQHMARISDTSEVKEDIRNIISQATIENAQLAEQREQFNDKIRVINKKLAKGVLNIDGATRAELLADITRLEIILESNKSSFYKNQEDYRVILNTIKEKFLHIEDLQQKLTLSESQRQEEQEAFRRKMLITISIIVLTLLLVILLVYFSSKLGKQKKELMRANEEVKHVNENLERLVLQRTHMLEETNRELDTFLYKASHNLRAPVSSMIGLYNIASHQSSRESKELFDRAVDIAYSMDRLLRKLKVISEINRKSDPVKFSLVPLISAVKSHFGQQLRDNKIAFKVECSEDLFVESNHSLVEATLISLVENAIFFCALKEGVDREVDIVAAREVDQVVISVQDNGVGIPEALQSRIYDMFFVGHEQSTGNGLGLYIVQKALQAIDGTISIESELGSYTSFIVRIPVKLV